MVGAVATIADLAFSKQAKSVVLHALKLDGQKIDRSREL
jgi:hypothetical protein